MDVRRPRGQTVDERSHISGAVGRRSVEPRRQSDDDRFETVLLHREFIDDARDAIDRVGDARDGDRRQRTRERP